MAVTSTAWAGAAPREEDVVEAAGGVGLVGAAVPTVLVGEATAGKAGGCAGRGCRGCASEYFRHEVGERSHNGKRYAPPGPRLHLGRGGDKFNRNPRIGSAGAANLLRARGVVVSFGQSSSASLFSIDREVALLPDERQTDHSDRGCKTSVLGGARTE